MRPSSLYAKPSCPAARPCDLLDLPHGPTVWRWPRLVAKGDPDRGQVLAHLQQQIKQLPDGAVVQAEDESFYMLTGTLDVECGDDRFQAGPGSLCSYRATCHTSSGPRVALQRRC